MDANTMTSEERRLRQDLDALKADLGTIKDDLGVLIRDAAQTGKTVAGEVRDRAGEAAEHLKVKGRAAYDSAKAKGSAAKEAVETHIEDHPFASVGIAFGVGLLVGALLSRR